MANDSDIKIVHQVAGKGAVARHYDRMHGKVSIITGAGQGIGRAAALLFARERAQVVVADWNPTSGQETADMIHEEGGEAIFFRCDVTNETEVQGMVAETLSAFGRLDNLVNNAGIYPVVGGIVETSEEDWDACQERNEKSTFSRVKKASD